jgi:hypothetical protein
MAGLDDLQTALSDFVQGAKSLQTQRALQNANDQVSQIKSGEASEAQQRQALAGVAQNLTMNLTNLGMGPEQIAGAAGAVNPPQQTFKDSSAMFQHGLLNNDPNMQAQAQKLWQFENQGAPAGPSPYQKAELGLEDAKFQNQKDQQNTTDFANFGKALNPDMQSSRSPYGQWAITDQRGQRLDAIMQDPSHWKNMSIPDMSLVAEGIGNMAKGAALTADERQHLQNMSAQMYGAIGKSKLTNQPASLDLSGYMKDYQNVVDSEASTAKAGMLKDIVFNASAQAKSLYKRDPDQYQNTVAEALNRHLGFDVKPSDIGVDSKGQLNIPGVTDKLQAVNQAPKMLASAIKDLRDPNASNEDKQGAQKMLDAYGITPNMKPQDAIKVMQRKMKASIFQGAQ